MNLTHHLHHFAVEVPDLDAALRWYEEKLGFTFERRFRLEEAGIEIAYLTAGAGRIELLQRDEAPPAPSNGAQPMHFCFEVDDVAAAAAELKRRGVAFAQEVTVIAPAKVKNCWILDPAGYRIEFVERLD